MERHEPHRKRRKKAVVAGPVKAQLILVGGEVERYVLGLGRVSRVS